VYFTTPQGGAVFSASSMTWCGSLPFNGGDNNVSRRQVAKGAHNLISSGHKTEDIDVKNNREQLARMPEESQRPGWRQLR